MRLLIPENNKRSVENLFTDAETQLDEVAFGETLPLEVGILSKITNPTTTRRWTPQDLTGWTIRAGIGKSFQLPLAGTFTLTVDGNTTAAIAYNAGAAAVEAAINLTGADVTVESVAAGYFFVTFNDATTHAQITASAVNLAPLSNIDIGTLINAPGGTLSEVQTIRLLQNPGSYAVLSTDSEVADADVDVLQVGGGGSNHTIRVSLEPLPYDGRWTLTVDGEETAPLAWDISADDLTAALEALSNVGADHVEVFKEEEGIYLISFFDTLTTTATGTLTLSGNPSDTQTVSVGGKLYTFQTTLTNVANNVLRGASASDSIDNLVAAITLGAGSGTVYAALTTVNANVTAAAGAGDTMVATALVPGAAGNSISTTETLSAGSWGASTLTGGADAASENMGTITADPAGLRVIPLRSGELDLSTPGIELLLAGQESVSVFLEIEGTPSGGSPRKLYKKPILLVAAVIDPASMSPQPRPSFYSSDEVDDLLEDLNASNLTSGTIPDARYAATAALRIAASGVKVWSTGAALVAGAPDFAGQPQVALDGYFAVPRAGGTGNHDDDMVLAAGQVYYNHLERGTGGTIHSGKITVEPPAGTYYDNALDIKNDSGGYPAIAFYLPGEPLPGTAAHGLGIPGSAYEGTCYLATNPPTGSPTSAPKNITIYQEQTDTATYRIHPRIECHGTNRTVTIFGWVDDVPGNAPAGVVVNAAAEVAIGVGGTDTKRIKHGTATLSSGAVTVSDVTVTASSLILLTVQSLGTVAAPQAVAVTARSAGTSFTITSADNTDTSVVAWLMVEP